MSSLTLLHAEIKCNYLVFQMYRLEPYHFYGGSYFFTTRAMSRGNRIGSVGHTDMKFGVGMYLDHILDELDQQNVIDQGSRSPGLEM